MKLKDLLREASKAQLQGYFLHWHPGGEVLSDRERLTVDLQEVMADAARARDRFDALPKAHRAFVISLLVREGYSGTVEEVRAEKHGRVIEDFEVETVLKGLQEAGYIVKTAGSGGYSSEVFSIPEELAFALRRTISVEERLPLEMLSAARCPPGMSRERIEAGGSVSDGGVPGASSSRQRARPGGVERADERTCPEDNGYEPLTAEEARKRVARLKDKKLRRLVTLALQDHLGILTHSVAGEDHLNRSEWREELEKSQLGTTGVLSLKDYGIGLEEEGVFVYQEVVREINLSLAHEEDGPQDREISLGADLIIDLDRALEILRLEPLEVTREGNVYKKIEERIAGQFVTTQYAEIHDGSAVGAVLELCRRLHFFDEEGQRIVPDPLRRVVWRKKSLLKKVHKVFDLFRNENRGQRWSFHQTSIREIFVEQLRGLSPETWVVARPFLTCAISKYLLSLDRAKVSADFHERCADDFRHETLVVPLPKLYHDLSYWVVYRLALLGLVDIGYQDGAFHSLQLSRLGGRFFAWNDAFGEADRNGNSDSSTEASETNGEEAPPMAKAGPCPVLVNPDFEILIYPEAPEEVSWRVSFFADRVDSERVKRYRLSRESLKRGIVAGLSREEILTFLQGTARGTIPSNVEFSLREWTEGVELVRRQKVLLLRATTRGGADRVGEILERQDVTFERLNETAIVVRGGKNERAVDDLQQHFRESGLFVE